MTLEATWHELCVSPSPTPRSVTRRVNRDPEDEFRFESKTNEMSQYDLIFDILMVLVGIRLIVIDV